jgi:hypothetical protein
MIICGKICGQVFKDVLMCGKCIEKQVDNNKKMCVIKTHKSKCGRVA